jgi:hypothetical protein
MAGETCGCGGSCACGGGHAHGHDQAEVYLTREEYVARLEQYLVDLKAEIKAVEEELVSMRETA